jgi:lactate permease
MTSLLDWLLALLPILAVLVLMLGFRWDGARAGTVGWLVALVVGALRFGAGWQVLAYAQLKGLLLALYVLYIIWGALLFYCVTDEAGAVETVGAGLLRLTPDRGLQALLLGWVFSAFLQGVGGFGVPVAVIAPLLVGLGFPALAAVVIPSVGHPWAVGFGSLGSSMTAMVAATGRSAAEIAPWSAAMMGLTCLGCGAATLWAAGGWPALKTGLAPLFVVGPVMAAVLFLVATHRMDVIGSMMAGLAGLAVGVAWAWWSGRKAKQADPQNAYAGNGSRNKARMPLFWAFAPYVLLVVIILSAELISPVKQFLNSHAVISHQFPELVTARGWITPAGKGRTIAVLGHAGALLTYASLAAYGLYRLRGYYRPGAERRIAQGVVKRALRSSLGTAAMVGMAATMEHAGMTYLLADGIAKVAGRAFPLVSPFIGALGAFMTGSNTNSNVVFGNLQQSVAMIIGVSPLVIIAAQMAGGSIGSAFAPAKIIVGCSTVRAEEAPVLRAVMRYGLAITAGVALATTAAVYLFH